MQKALPSFDRLYRILSKKSASHVRRSWTMTGAAASRSFPACFMRGGTSNGLMILRKHLPDHEDEWQPILASAMGSPDSYGRQLNGMGSGISSTSKICVVSRSERMGTDVDYTFVQVGIQDGSLDMAGNCGNMSSAVGPFALNEGLVPHVKRNEDGCEVTLRLYNTNTSKTLHATFSIRPDELQYEPDGEYSIDGVPGVGSRITLSFIDPAGAKTGKALPTGNAVDTLRLPDGSSIAASLTDIANPGVFVMASDIGVAGDIHPDALGSNSNIMARLEQVRQEGAKMMGLNPNTQSIPKIVLLSKPSTSHPGVDIVCRALSMRQAHKAVPLTIALNLGAACRLQGTLPHQIAGSSPAKANIVIAHASGKLEVGCLMSDGRIESALLHRTARVLMKGHVYY